MYGKKQLWTITICYLGVIMNEMITVIIPVYNAEEYLDECINSVCKQTYKNLQIIIVNDGSTDASRDICERYATKDSRILLINKANGGQASARNVALNKTEGDYICFLDSDDMMKNDMLEKLYKIHKKTESDIVVCGFQKFENKVQVNESNSVLEKTYSKEEALLDICMDKYLKTYVWNKLFVKSLFLNMRFQAGRVFEDTALVANIMCQAKKIAYTSEKLYYYRIREGSTVRQYSEKRYLDELWAYNQQLNLMNVYCSKGKVWIECKIAEIIRDLIDYDYITPNDSLSINMRDIYRKHLLFILTNKSYSKGMKIAALLNACSVNIYTSIKKIWRKR